MANEHETNNTENRSKDLNKFLIMNIASMVILGIFLIGTTYFVVKSIISQEVGKIKVTQEELDEEGEGDEIQRGIIVDLGDFILNLCDEAQKKYLKVNVAIEVSQKDTDFPKEDTAAKSGGHGHGEAPATANPMDAIQQEMTQFKPAIRDAVITNLSSKTSAELSTTAGKELAKEQITNDINSILGGEREVLRVSFGQFIIQ